MQLCEGLLSIFFNGCDTKVVFKRGKIQKSNNVSHQSQEMGDEVLDLGSYKNTVSIEPQSDMATSEHRNTFGGAAQ